MRVTKLIREYVEKKINEAIPMVVLPEYDELRKRRNAAEKEYWEKLRESASALRMGLNVKYDLPEDWKLACTKRYGMAHSIELECVNYRNDLSTQNSELESSIRQRRAEAIESILLELELGATKADLERLISEAVSK